MAQRIQKRHFKKLILFFIKISIFKCVSLNLFENLLIFFRSSQTQIKSLKI